MITPQQQRTADLVHSQGFAIVNLRNSHGFALEDAWIVLVDDWNHLELDKHMADGGEYRRRRVGRYFWSPTTRELIRLPHAAVYQSRDINGFAGGIERHFAPLRDSTFNNPWLLHTICEDFLIFQSSKEGRALDTWEVCVHQIRIATIGDREAPPTPEGIHRDGHDFVAMHLIGRTNVLGGESLIYDNFGKRLHTKLLETALDTIYADDRRVAHGTEPIRTILQDQLATRDMLIIDYDHRPELVRPA